MFGVEPIAALGATAVSATVLVLFVLGVRNGLFDRFEDVLQEVRVPGTPPPTPVEPARRLTGLDPDELRRRLRVEITRRDGPLSPCARPVSANYQASAVLAGFAWSGLPGEVRDRLPIDDDAVFALALEQTRPSELPPLTQAPGPARLWRIPGWVWLQEPRRVFRDASVFVVAGPDGLVWAEIDRPNLHQDLLGLCDIADKGPLRLAMWVWDDGRLDEVEVVGQAIPDLSERAPAPAFVVTLPPLLAPKLGLGSVVGLWRR